MLINAESMERRPIFGLNGSLLLIGGYQPQDYQQERIAQAIYSCAGSVLPWKTETKLLLFK
jgi:hypothetical protein